MAAQCPYVVREVSVDDSLFHPTALQEILPNEGVVGHESLGFGGGSNIERDQPPDLSAKGPPK